jgi:signal transduction histidine kinase
MKLLTRTTLVYVTITVAVFAFGSCLFYSFLTDLVLEEADELLEVKKELVIQEFDTYETMRDANSGHHVFILSDPASEEYISDTVLFDEHMGEELPFRAIHFPYEKSGVTYHIMILQPLLETDDLQEGMISSFLTSLGFLIALVVIFMWIASRRIWKPFFNTLSELKGFAPGRKHALSLPETRVKEFRELNTAIENMAANTEASFHALKSFSENAAHEIQTPLAVIQSTTEVLLQDESLSEEQHNKIAHLSSTTARLSNIVTTLLLLTRIENKQFQQETPIDLSEIVNAKLNLFRELFEQKSISVTNAVAPGVQVKLHRVLAEILVSNLIVNALRHTKEEGRVFVVLNQNEFVVKNSGVPLKGDANRIFERFYKEDQSELSTGLGLSLVKMAAEASGLQISYSFENGNHVFSLSF